MLSTHFLRIILIFIKTRNSRRESGGIPQVFARERGAPSRDSFSRIGFFDTRREAAFPRERNDARAG